MKALVYIAGACPVRRIIHDIASNRSGVNPLGFTHTAFVKYQGEARVVCAASAEASTWYDLYIPPSQLKAYLQAECCNGVFYGS